MVNPPDFMEDFVFNYFNPKCEQLKNKLFEQFKSETDYSIESASDIEQAKTVTDIIQNKVMEEFYKQYDILLEQSLKEYTDIQLDLFNNNQITKEQLVYRTSWIHHVGDLNENN